MSKKLTREDFETQVEYELYLAEEKYDKYSQCCSDCKACHKKEKTALKDVKRKTGKLIEYNKRHGRTTRILEQLNSV